MKKIFLIMMCLAMCAGCSSNSPRESKAEIYNQAYKDGYMDAVEAVIDEMPWRMVDADELEESLDIIFDDNEFANELRDQIFSYCELYERTDFKIPYSNLGMDDAY